MGPLAMSVFLLVVLTATLSAGHAVVHAEGRSAPDEGTSGTNMTVVDNQCSPLQRRQDLLDTRLNEVDDRMTERNSNVNTQLNSLDTRLNARQSEVNTRLDRMDRRLDGIETALTDMKDFLQSRMEAMDKKVEWALTDITPKHDCTAKQDMKEYLRQRVEAMDVKAELTVGNQPNRTSQNKVPKDCQEAYTMGMTSSGVYRVAPEPNTYMDVLCDQEVDGGGWIVFQLRKDGTVDFYRTWSAYEDGFGELTGQFWFGNHKIHLLTKQHDQQLKVELTSPEGETRYADYANFWIGDKVNKYTLNVSGFSGGSPPGDSLEYHNGHPFSTKDVDNDGASTSCATSHRGGWWYHRCHHSNLNGLYGNGLIWKHWKGFHVSMKSTRMLLRRRPV